mmetsp:Transcript_89196/g.216352  ORF Transcript_89196/g.216352 Transcript_89196/m.216352 type:complete len:245 (-) Transcript_89196:328-1062(-)
MHGMKSERSEFVRSMRYCSNAQHTSSTSVATMAMRPKMIHDNISMREMKIVKKIMRRNNPKKPSAHIVMDRPKIAPAMIVMYSPAGSNDLSMRSCIFCASFSTACAAVTKPLVALLTETELMDASADAVFIVVWIVFASVTRAVVCLTSAAVKAEVLSMRTGPSAKTRKDPQAMTITNMNIAIRLIFTSRFVNLRGLYALLQHLQHVAPNSLDKMYTTSMRIMMTIRTNPMAIPGMPCPMRDIM